MRTAIILTAALVALPSVAAAAEPVREIVVHATRFDPYRGDAVFSTVDVAKAQIADAASVDTALKMAAQASLFRRSSSLTANPTVQGLGLRAIAPSGAGRALVTLDGIPQNDPFGNWVVWAGIPKAAVSSVHVLRGAGGGAYGAGALTGIVDMTLDRTPGVYGNVTAGEGGGDIALGGATGGLGLNYNDETLHGDVPVRGTQRGAADVPTYGRDRAWLIDGATQLCPLNICGQAALLAGAYDSRRDTGLRGATAISHGNQQALSFTRAPTPEHDGFRLQLWRKASGLANSSVSVSADRATTTLANAQVATPATGDGFNAALRHQDRQTEWEVGIDGRRNEGEEHEYYRYVAGTSTRYRVAGGRTSLIGVYGEGTQQLGLWTFTGALRADRWRTAEGHRTETDLTNHAVVLDLHPADQDVTVASARAGLAYAVTASSSLRLAAYTGFRPPSLNELYRPFRVGNDVTEANGNLRPETLKGIETGYRATSGNGLIDVDLFYNVVKGPITNVTLGIGPFTDPVAGVILAGAAYRQRQNLGQIDAWGLEAQGRYDLTARLAVTGSATATHARVSQAGALNGKRPAEAPDYAAAVGLSGHCASWTLDGDLMLEGTAFDDDLNSLKLKPSQTVHLAVSYAIGPHLSLRAEVYNALDSAIQISHAADGTLGYDNRRSARVALTYRR